MWKEIKPLLDGGLKKFLGKIWDSLGKDGIFAENCGRLFQCQLARSSRFCGVFYTKDNRKSEQNNISEAVSELGIITLPLRESRRILQSKMSR